MSELTENDAFVHLFLYDYTKMQNSECEVMAYSVPQGHPVLGETHPFYSQTQVNQLRAELEQEQNQIALCKLESETLAMSIYNKSYKDDSPNFELCDTPAGVLTQIDNMVAGLYQELEQVKKDSKLLSDTLKWLSSVSELDCEDQGRVDWAIKAVDKGES